eukprot:4731652-Amphidinium_carterae.1
MIIVATVFSVLFCLLRLAWFESALKCAHTLTHQNIWKMQPIEQEIGNIRSQETIDPPRSRP